MDNPFDEVMWNVRRNLAVLHAGLTSLGYRFSNPESALRAPNPEVENLIGFLEMNMGKVPAALTAFYRIVGSVDFTGTHPAWNGCEYPDPIVVGSVEGAVSEAKEFIELESAGEYWGSDNGVFRIPVAPDFYHKENVSGGMWYGVELPNEKDDPDLLEEWHQTTFIGYLRLCFQWGGFPGLEHVETQHTWPLAKLKAGLVAI